MLTSISSKMSALSFLSLLAALTTTMVSAAQPLKVLNMKEMIAQHSKIHFSNLMAQKQKHIESRPSQRKLVR